MIYTKRLLTAFFVVLYKPIYTVLRIIFYKVIVKGYLIYLSLIRKLGWSVKKNNFFSYLLGQKLVHILVVVITIIITFTNLSEKTNAGVIEESAKNTIIAKLVKSEFGQLEDDEIIEETIDETINVSPHKSSYLETNVALKNAPQALMLNQDEIDTEEDVSQTTQGGTALIKPEIASTKKTKQTRTEIISYTVKPGDSVSTIAQEFEISVNTILWENKLSAYSLIRPGQSLRILPATGISHTVTRGENISSISKKYSIDEDKIILANKLSSKSKLSISQKLLIPGGRKINYSSGSSPSYTGISAIKNLIKPSSASPATSNKMNWPTDGHRITQYYSWRHHGLDIANKIGTPLYAADAGTIEFAGWSTGYGNNIIINHGGGKKTRYAHLSKFYSKKGDKVGKGESIGGMGSTGWSTGSHLHFEVIINGRKYNPLNYIK